MMKWFVLIFCVLLLAAFLVPFVVTRIENQQVQQNRIRLKEPQADATNPDKVAVVVFSRSGNTAVLARHIAEKTGGALLFIQAEAYAPGLPGWVNAMKDARSQTAVITPESIDLSEFETVFLGAPIWLYSPAPPVWQLAANTEFSGQHIVLFNTYNSHFEQSYIDAFETWVKANGAQSFEHVAVLRGRMGSQLTTEEMLQQFEQHRLVKRQMKRPDEKADELNNE